MFNFIDRNPFISGFFIGFFSVGLFGKSLKKLLAGKITIIQIDSTGFLNKSLSGEEDQEVKET